MIPFTLWVKSATSRYRNVFHNALLRWPSVCFGVIGLLCYVPRVLAKTGGVEKISNILRISGEILIVKFFFSNTHFSRLKVQVRWSCTAGLPLPTPKHTPPRPMFATVPLFMSLLTFMFMLVQVCPREAQAIEYPVVLSISDENDIHDLYYNGEITEEMRDSLLNLLRDKVDLNKASRDELYELPGFTFEMADAVIAYRESGNRFNHPSDLALVAAIPHDVLVQVMQFVMATPPPPPRPPIMKGQVKAGAVERLGDDEGPEGYLQLQGTVLRYVDVGTVLTYRHVPPPPSFYASEDINYYMVDPKGTDFTMSGLYAGGIRYGLDHIYAMREENDWVALIGSFKAGFGLKLTMDNTGRTDPTGFYANTDYYENYTSGSVGVGQGFFGAAFRYKELELGPGTIDTTVFASSANRDSYQYYVRYGDDSIECWANSDCREISPWAQCDKVTNRCYDTSVCPESPEVCEDRLSFMSLSEVYRETVVGGNVTYSLDSRKGIGLTGYVGHYGFNVEAPSIRFSPSVRFPERPVLGAVGLHGFWGWSMFDFDLESAVTDQGSAAVVGRMVAEFSKAFQVTLLGRYYPTSFDNPYARSYSDSSMYKGNRTRDHGGGMLKVTWRPVRPLHIAADVDVVKHLMLGTWDAEANLRANYSITKTESAGVVFYLRDNDLSKGGRIRAYGERVDADLDMDEGYYEDENARVIDAPIRGAGQKHSVAMRFTTTRIPRTNIQVFGKHIWEDVKTFDDRFERSFYVWGKATLNLAPGPKVSLRVRYYDDQLNELARAGENTRAYCAEERSTGALFDVIPSSCRGETSLESYFDVTQVFKSTGTALSARAGMLTFIDDRIYNPPGGAVEGQDPKRPDQWSLRAYVTQRF